MKVTFIIDNSPDCWACLKAGFDEVKLKKRSISIELTSEQLQKAKLNSGEDYVDCFIESEVKR